MQDRLLTLQEVADERLHVHINTVYNLLYAGELPSVSIGRARRIRESDLDAYIASLETTAVGQ